MFYFKKILKNHYKFTLSFIRSVEVSGICAKYLHFRENFSGHVTLQVTKRNFDFPLFRQNLSNLHLARLPTPDDPLI